MCDSYCWLDRLYENQAIAEQRHVFDEQCNDLVWKVTGESLTFYRAWGEGNCKGCTSWCKGHCYMNIKEFMKGKRKKLKEVNSLPKYDTCIERYPYKVGEMPFKKDIEKAKYVTFFGSGTIIDSDDVKFIADTIRRYPNKEYRIFTRDLGFIEEFYGHTIIFSVDCSTDRKILEKALKNKNVNVAVLNHLDNRGIIEELKPKFSVILSCDECMKGGISRQLCFHEENRFLSIQNYESVGTDIDSLYRKA